MIKAARLPRRVLVAALMVAGLVAGQPGWADPGQDQASSVDRKPAASAMGLLQHGKKVPAPRSIAGTNRTAAAADVLVSAPSAAWAPDGSAFVVSESVGEDPQVLNGELDFRFWFDGDGWTEWFTLGKPAAGLTSAPSATWSANGNRVDFFATGTDKHLYQITIDFTQQSPSPWVDLGGELVSAPSASWVGNNRVDIFGIGPDLLMYQKTWTAAGGWTGWVSFAAPATGIGSEPTATWANSGRLDVFVTGNTDGRLNQKTWTTTGGWTDWVDLGGVLTSAPAASWTLNGGRIDVFGVGTDSRLHQKTWSVPTSWTGWVPFTPPAAGASLNPSISWTANGRRLDLVVTGDTDGRVYQKAWTATGGWTDWVDLG